ncbi:MAG: alkaline phosphatase family protein [Kineosporiaceae bacterium]|nr:alkaline phosphatase family protein [Aeromicrobium sp.]
MNVFDNVLGVPEAPRYVVLLVDGLGYDLLREAGDAAPFLSSLLVDKPMTVGVPSTTATSLTSLGTGLTAGQHGVVGYTSRVPGTTQRLNSLKWDQPIDPRDWQPHATVLHTMTAAGIEASVVNDAKFAGSGLTLCSQRDVPFYGVNSVWERLEVILDTVEATPRSVVYAYESRLDHTGHSKGCDSEEWRSMLTTIDNDLQHLRAELPADTVLIVTADHGMIDLPREGRFDANEQHGLLDDVVLLAGEARFRHLHTRAGAEADVAARWSEVLEDRAIVRTQAGIEDWFGPITPEVRPRIGDVLVASLGDFAVFSSKEFAIELKMRGFHGSVTAAEMQVPLLIAHDSVSRRD